MEYVLRLDEITMDHLAMVSARAAGVMFTANPMTGDRDEIVINANPGLGTVVVSGQVTPDTYRLDKATLRVRERDVAEKVDMEVAEDEGTRLIPVPERQRRMSTLSRRQCSELGRLGRRIEGHFSARFGWLPAPPMGAPA